MELQSGEKPDADTEHKEDHLETNPTALRGTQVHSGYSVCAGLIRSCEPSLQTPRHSNSHMRPFQSIRSLLVHPKDKHRPQDICECVYKIPSRNCNKTYIGETGRAFGVQLQEHRQEVSQRDVRAYTRSTSRSLTGEQNKSAVTDHAISLNHVIDGDQAKVIDRASNRVDRWIKEAIHIRKEQVTSMNRDKGSYQLSHIYDNLFAPKLSGER